MEKFPDDRPIFEARPADGIAWEVWDIEHPAECNHFPILRVDGKGAMDDLHQDVAHICADALNARYAANANLQRREEISCTEGLKQG